MRQCETRVLHAPVSEQLRYLPEGPYRCTGNRLSWVAIQHAKEIKAGSLNLLDLNSGQCLTYPLPGRPGFAFPTTADGIFLLGMERSLCLFNPASGQLDYLVEGIDRDVDGTIINDAVVFDGHLVFGCKDLEFATPKAGLYLLRHDEVDPVLLDATQVCSNGKAVLKTERGLALLDICSASKQVKSYILDLDRGALRDPRVVVDLTDEPVFPDGMILTPDQQSVIIAIYDPREDAVHGQARQYALADGSLQATWVCPRSPRVTCPQLIEDQHGIQLVLTTAVEGMTSAARSRCSDAGCLFIGPTDLDRLNVAEPYLLPARAV